MSQPPYPYNRIFDFESFSINTPAAQQPGVQLEGEYDAIKRTIDSLISRLAEIQRDDGKLKGDAFDITTAGAVYTAILALLQPTLALKANLASPALTGTPTAPTPVTNSNNTAIATTAFVKAQGYATTTSLNNAINSVNESINNGINAVNERVDDAILEIEDKLDKTDGGIVNGKVTLNNETLVNNYMILNSNGSFNSGISLREFGQTSVGAEINNRSLTYTFSFSNGNWSSNTISATGIYLSNYMQDKALELRNSQIEFRDHSGSNNVILSRSIPDNLLSISTGIKFGDGTKQLSAFAPADYATNTSVDTKIATRLPIAGGTLTGNLIIDTGNGSSGHYETTEMFVTRTDAGAGQSNSYGALYNGGVEVGDIDGKWAELTTAHLRFGDGTIQTTAATANAFLPLTGGTIAGDLNLDGNGITNIANVSASTLTFNDSTVQSTAGLPLTGGIVTSNAIKVINDAGDTMEYPVSASIDISAENGISLKWIGGGGEFFDSEIKLYDGINTFTGTNNFTGGKISFGSTTARPYISGSLVSIEDNGSYSYSGTALTVTQIGTANALVVSGKSVFNAGSTIAPINIGASVTPTSTINGDIWISTGAIRYKDAGGVERIVADTNRPNTYTTNNTFQNSTSNPTVTINASGTGTALKVTNTGTGESLRVEDETSPDATPFVISNSGRVGIGIAPDATVALTVDSTGIKVNGATLIPASAVTNSPSSPVYSKELVIKINGVNYGIPLRVV
jgi:hypothetical protein